MNNILHSVYRMSMEEYFRFEDLEHMEEHIHAMMTRQIADLLLEQIPINKERNFAFNEDIYSVNCAVVTEERYRQLLKQERDLRDIRRLITG